MLAHRRVGFSPQRGACDLTSWPECSGETIRPWEGRRDWVRSSCMPLRSLLLVVLLTHPVFAQTGTVPADRPRSRPPSALTGWADWEKGEELLKRIQVPPAPVLSAEDEAKTFKLAPGYGAEPSKACGESLLQRCLGKHGDL